VAVNTLELMQKRGGDSLAVLESVSIYVHTVVPMEDLILQCWIRHRRSRHAVASRSFLTDACTSPRPRIRA